MSPSVSCFNVGARAPLCLALACGSLLAQASHQPAPLAAPTQGRESNNQSAISNLNSVDLKTGHEVADSSQLPKIVPTGRLTIGVALEGGGALGLAHIGVLKWMEDNHIPVDRIAGTSMGALIGGLYASGHSPAEMRQIATSDVFRRVFAIDTPYSDASFRRREDRTELPQAIVLSLQGGASLRNALLSDSGLNGFLTANFDRYNRSDLSYDALPIPFRCVATDLNTLQAVVLAGGPMPQAVRASIAIPGVFPPVPYRGHYLVDGGILDNLPIDIVKQDLHSGVVIAVHLSTPGFSASDVGSVVGVLARAFSAGTARNEGLSKGLADVLIAVNTAAFSTGDYSKASDLITAGYDAAESNRAALEKYALDDAGWAAHMADRTLRERPRPSILRVVKIEGGSSGAQAEAWSYVSSQKGKPIDAAALSGAVRRVEGNGTYQANFETLSPETPAPSDKVMAAGPDTGVLVRLDKVRNGPPFLLIGADLTAVSSNVTRSSLDFRLVDQDLGGYGSELRADVRVGFLTQASVEYYRLLSHSGYYLQPHIGIIREPVYLWQDQKRVSERLSQQSGGGLDFGRTFNSHLQAAVEWRAEMLRWHLVNGSDGTQNISGTAQTIVAHVVYNSAESGTISPRGSHLDISAGSLFGAVGSRNAPLARIKADRAFAVAGRGIVAFSAEGDTYFGRNVAEPLRFTLGGPLRLSASSIDEYRGTDNFLLRSAYLHRIATLPSGLGQGVYLTLGYEAGESWAPERRALLRQDGFLSVIAATPLGAITVGGALGDAGRRKVFVSFGRLF